MCIIIAEERKYNIETIELRCFTQLFNGYVCEELCIENQKLALNVYHVTWLRHYLIVE